MHNDIMAAGSKDRPLMLATGRYARPFVMAEVTVPQPATADAPAVPTHKVPETFMNITPENHAHFGAKTKEIYMILSGIRDDVYSTFDACKTAQEMWVAIERLQQEWSRFVTIVKQAEDLEKVSYHKLFYILKQYHNEANEIHVEKLARNENPLALVAATQHYPEYHNQEQKPHKLIAPSSRQIKSSKSHATSQSKEIQKSLALIAKHFKNIYKPTKKNLRTSSNTMNKNRDTSPRNKNDNQTGRFRHMDKEYRKPNKIKDYAYHKEKMMLCKHKEIGVPLSADQGDWLDDINEEPDE
nr:hypothetical protein [Tanacetum cinerariifolium]